MFIVVIILAVVQWQGSSCMDYLDNTKIMMYNIFNRLLPFVVKHITPYHLLQDLTRKSKTLFSRVFLKLNLIIKVSHHICITYIRTYVFMYIYIVSYDPTVHSYIITNIIIIIDIMTTDYIQRRKKKEKEFLVFRP